MTSTSWLAGALVLLVLTAGCLGAVQPADDPAADGPESDDSTISVAATGSATADPDLALVRVAVEVRAETAEAAREAAARDASGMREALRELGVPDDAVETTGFSIRPEYDHRSDSRELIGYTAVHSFEIESEVDEAGAVIDAAVRGGASRVDGVQFTLQEETRRDLRQTALTAAMTDARADAETIASAGGVRVGSLHAASTSDVRFIPVEYRLAEDGAADASTTIEPGPVTVTASVQATYTIA